MDCPPDIGRSILRKWNEEGAMLNVALNVIQFNMSRFVMVVVEVTERGTRLVSPIVHTASGDEVRIPGELLIDFEGASFEYGEPREAAEEIRDEAEALLVSALVIKFPDIHITFSEMRGWTTSPRT